MWDVRSSVPLHTLTPAAGVAGAGDAGKPKSGADDGESDKLLAAAWIGETRFAVGGSDAKLTLGTIAGLA